MCVGLTIIIEALTDGVDDDRRYDDRDRRYDDRRDYRDDRRDDYRGGDRSVYKSEGNGGLC